MSLFSTSLANQPPGDDKIVVLTDDDLCDEAPNPPQPLFADPNETPGFAQVPTRTARQAVKPLPTPSAEIAEAVGVLLCPRCQEKLIDPKGLGWCRACGYCKSIEDDKGKLPAKAVAAAPQASALGVVEFGILLTKVPQWVYLLLLGCGAVFGFSLLANRYLPPDSLQRAQWTTMQIAFGLLVIFVAQLLVLFVLAPADEKLSFKDALMPFRLWGLAVQRGGRFKVPFWLASWGFSAVVAAVFTIGGLEYWYRYIPRSQVPPEPAPQAAPKKR